LDRKMDGTFFDGLHELYHHAKFGEGRTMRAGCRCENVVFVCFFLSRSEAGELFVQGVHSSDKHCVAVYCRFRRGFQRFFQKGLLFQMHYIVRIFVARWRHNFREIAVKNCKNPKNRRQSLCAPIRIDS